MDYVIIDNCVVSYIQNEFRIRPINIVQKLNPEFDINQVKKITYGSRMSDNKVLNLLACGKLQFSDLPKIN